MIFIRTYCLSLIYHYPRSSYLYIITPFLSHARKSVPYLLCYTSNSIPACSFFFYYFLSFVCVSTVFRQTCSMCMYGRRLKQYLVEIITCLACLLRHFHSRRSIQRPPITNNTHGAHVTSLMAFFTDEPMSHDYDACKKGTSYDRPTQLSYTIAGCSEHSNRFVAENILVDLPSDPNSRWSGLHENPSIKQWILLRLDTLCVIGKSLDSPTG